MKSGSCQRCGSANIILNAEISSCAAANLPRRPMRSALNSSPTTGKLIEILSKSGEMRSWICGQCGFAEIYALGIKDISIK